MKRRDSILAALFLDLPFLVDSFWRKFEYEANRNHVYRITESAGTIAPRPLRRAAHFWWLLLVIVFVGYGPTHAPLCGIGGDTLPRVLYGALALCVVAAGCVFVLRFGRTLIERGRERLRKCHATPLRRGMLWVVLGSFILIGAMGFAGVAYQLATIAMQPTICQSPGWHWRSIALFVLSATTVVAAFLIARRSNGARFWLLQQPILIVAFALIVWFAVATSTAREADALPYRHAYTLVAFALFALALLAHRFARRLFAASSARLKDDFNLALRHSELFVRRGDPDLSVHRVWHALVNGAVYQPLLLFLLPSLVALVLPDRYLYGGCAAAFVFSGLLLAWGSISTRWRQMVLYVRRWFLTGTPFAVSLLVIALAAARLAGNQYVATVLAAAPFGAIFMWIVMIYGLLWLFEQVVNQALGVQLLQIFDAHSMERGYAGYPTQDFEHPRVAAKDRYLTIHGAGRFAVVGRLKKRATEVTAFHTYGYSELFAALAANGALLEKSLGDRHLARRLTDGAHEIERRSKLYFNLVNAVLILMGVGIAIYAQYHDAHHTTQPVVTAELGAPSATRFDLARVLAQRAREQRPVIIVAASGGGTRAALYTASALEGLARLGVADDIVLVSGVSGGGVALADYAMHRQQLADGDYDAQVWSDYKERLTQPFIQDVIEGAMEWRLIGAAPLSALLVESFERRIDHDARFGAIGDVGLILNTSITGHPAHDSALLSNAVQLRDADNVENCVPYSYLSGARLAFTNIAAQAAFPPFRASQLPDVDFPYVLVADPDVSIAAAAALNANFPPVFPNARVDLRDPTFEHCGGVRSYYVTDGGATENLGLISALYALQSALHDWPSDAPLPPIHIIALEASATDFDYRQDRGISTATGGSKERLAGGLTASLLRSLEARIGDIHGARADSLQLHYLAMPLPLRSRGGVGTHWMLANDILVTNPHRIAPVSFAARAFAIGPGASDRVRITREELFSLLDAMHSPDGPLCTTTSTFTRDAREVADWICGVGHAGGADLHVHEWQRLIETFASDISSRDHSSGLALDSTRE